MKIFFVLIFVLLMPIYAYEFKLNNFQKQYLEKKDPKLLNKYNKISKDIREKKKVFAIFAFVSQSVPQEKMNEYVNTMKMNISKNVKNGIYYNGITKDLYGKIKKTIMNANQSGLYTQVRFDPTFFKQYNIKKVPVLSLSLCDVNDIYPSECKVLFMIHGTMDVNFFAHKIVSVDDRYQEILK